MKTRLRMLSVVALTACSPGKFDDFVGERSPAMDGGGTPGLDASMPFDAASDASVPDAAHDAAALDAALDAEIDAGPFLDNCGQLPPVAPFGVDDGGVLFAGSIGQSDRVAPRWPTNVVAVGDQLWWLFGWTFKPNPSLQVAELDSITNSGSASPYTLREAELGAPAPTTFVSPVAADQNAMASYEQLTHLEGSLLMTGPSDALYFYAPAALSGNGVSFVSRLLGTRVANVHFENNQAKATPHEALVFGPDKPAFRFGLLAGGYVYLYGCVSPLYGVFNCMLARAPQDHAADGTSYQFRGKDAWTSDFSSAAVVLDAARDELSVSYNAYLKQYIAVHMFGYASELHLRVAPAPEGPWLPLTTITLPAPEVRQAAHQGGIEQPQLGSSCGRKLMLTYLYSRAGDASELRRIEVMLRQ